MKTFTAKLICSKGPVLVGKTIETHKFEGTNLHVNLRCIKHSVQFVISE
jgi:hypothetical protein